MEGNPKQAIAQRIKDATNILVTVSRNPSVDDLAAALAFTLMLNKMDKHATAVFSGAIPPAITFLEPSKTFENTVDSLRDFIVALDKEKADRLRYKVEDDMVRIYITPYRTTITKDDLQFTQGDFNVELIVALGVEKKDDLDAAISAHGRILHDAAVVTINDKVGQNNLGTVDWSDESASSLCEMLMSLSEALQSGLLDEQIASSLLTGIVAATDRFSNPHTSPKVMTMAAQLMAAGANQQLIAAKLEEGHGFSSDADQNTDQSSAAESKASQKISADQAQSTAGAIKVEHDQHKPQDTPTSAPAPQLSKTPASPDVSPSFSAPSTSPQLSELRKDLEAATQEVEADANKAVASKDSRPDWRGKIIEPPTMGGSLSATMDEAEQEKAREEQESRNHTILKHDSPLDTQLTTAATVEPPSVDPFAEPMNYEPTQQHEPLQPKAPTIMPIEANPPTSPFAPQPAKTFPTLEDLEEQAHASAKPQPEIANSLDDARAAVDKALGSYPPEPSQPAPQEPTFTSPPAPSFAEQTLPPPPPLPDFSTLPPLPPAMPEESVQPANPMFPAAPPADAPVNNPGQFRIPGQ